GIVFLICGAITMLAGCAERKAHAFPWATAVLVRPNVPSGHNSIAGEAADIAPDFRIDVPPNPMRVLVPRPAPVQPKPRTQNPAPAENTNGAKSSLLVPELSPEDAAAAKEQFSQNIGVAERNLAGARGRKLTPAQKDTVSKINGFLTEAREAAGE